MDKLRNLKGLLFDKDGTLIDFNQSWLQPMQEATALIAKHAKRPELAQRLMLDGGYQPKTNSWAHDSYFAFSTNEDIFAHWIALTNDKLINSIKSEIESIMYNSVKVFKPTISNLNDLFVDLSQQYRIGVASMDDAANVNKALNGLDIRQQVEFYCGADSGYGVKPQAGMVLEFCDQTGLKPHEIAVIGDGLHDLKMAKAAGSVAIAVLSGASSKESLSPHADYIFDDISSLAMLAK